MELKVSSCVVVAPFVMVIWAGLFSTGTSPMPMTEIVAERVYSPAGRESSMPVLPRYR